MIIQFNSFKVHNLVQLQEKPKYSNNSMSQDYHPQGLFSFSNVFEKQQEEQQQHIAHQIHQEKLRVQGFKPPLPLVAVEEGEESRGIQVYHEAAGMLSEMFNFQTTATAATATELLQSQLTHNYRHPNQQSHQQQQPSTTDLGSEWFGNRQGIAIAGGSSQVPPLGHDAKDLKILNNHDSITHYQRQHDINTAESMQLFLMNPQPRSRSTSTSSHPTTSTLQGFPNPTGGNFGQLICGGASTTANHFNTPNEIGGLNVIERQGLSLSLSSSLQHLGATKVEELRMNGGDMLFFNQGASQNHDQFHAGFGSSLGLVNALRNSKYAKATQELLEEFCSVGRGQIFKKNKVSRNNNNATASNPNSNPSGANNNSSSSKDNLPHLSAADRLEHQRRKVKLLSMLDDVDKRYNHYCEQMQMVVNSFDLVMGFGAAVPYTALAQKAMSRHFKCLKDAIATQLKQSCELLGEKDASSLGLTKGETPRLKILEQSLRQQRAFHQMGMMEQEAWRPQRGLPERSVNILRAWLFEHFLHPYPSDADKHLLARQTGLSRNQVANWFINARVRLWKPMVEDMYQQEAKEEEDEIIETSQNKNSSSNIAQTPKPSISSSSTNTMTTALTTTGTENKTADTGTITAALDKRSEIINVTENDPSIVSLNRHCCSSENQAQHHESMATRITQNNFPIMQDSNDTRSDGASRRDVFYRVKISGGDEMSHVEYGTTSMAGSSDIGSTMIKFGTSTAGDVSLTLGLRHAGNLPENSHFFG